MKRHGKRLPDAKKLIHPESQLGPTFGQLTIKQLAKYCYVPAERLKPLIEGGYLKVVKPAWPNGAFRTAVVEMPSPSVVVWIRMMLKPLSMRPLIRLREVAEIIGMKPTELRELCNRDKRIQFHYDPAFGELITPKLLYFVIKRLPKDYRIPSFDRARLIQFLTAEHGFKQVDSKMTMRMLPYSEHIEREIKRIAHLKEPYRTLRAVALFEAMRDAKTVVACMRQYREVAKREEVQVVDGSIKRLMTSL